MTFRQCSVPLSSRTTAEHEGDGAADDLERPRQDGVYNRQDKAQHMTKNDEDGQNWAADEKQCEHERGFHGVSPIVVRVEKQLKTELNVDSYTGNTSVDIARGNHRLLCASAGRLLKPVRSR